MSPYQKYISWKWRELSNRRLLYLLLFHFLLVTLWMNIYYLVAQVISDGGHSDIKILLTVPMVLACFHGVFIFFVTVTEKGKKLIREALGRYACYGTVLSFLLAEIFHLVLFDKVDDKSITNQTGVVFCVTSIIGAQIVSHIGISSELVNLLKLALVAPWIYFFAVLKIWILALIAILISFLVYHFFAILAEQDYLSSFEQLKSTTSSSWDIIADTVQTSFVINKAIKSCRMQTQSSAAKGNKASAASQYAKLQDEYPFDIDVCISDDLSVRPVKAQKEAVLAESEYLCKALIYALRNDQEILKPRERGSSTYKQFSFIEACNAVISLFEVSMSRGLPIYVDDSAKKVHITGPQSALELIILLLLYDVAHDEQGICIVSCDSSAGEGWRMKVQVVRELKSESIANNDVLVSHGDKQNGQYNLQRRAPKVISESWLLTKSVLDSQGTESKSSLMRLADCMARKDLQESVLESEPELCEGYSIANKSITLKNDVFSCTIDSYVPSMLAPEDSNVVEFSEQDERKKSVSSMSLEDSWVFLVHRVQDSSDLGDIKSKIDILGVPNVGYRSVNDMNKESVVFCYAVISETTLKLLGKAVCSSINNKVQHLIVAYDHVENAQYFLFEYGIEARFFLPIHAITLKHVYDCVQDIASRQLPRTTKNRISTPIESLAGVQRHIQSFSLSIQRIIHLYQINSKISDSLTILKSQLKDNCIKLETSALTISSLFDVRTRSTPAKMAQKFIQSMQMLIRALQSSLDNGLRDFALVLAKPAELRCGLPVHQTEPMKTFLNCLLRVVSVSQGKVMVEEYTTEAPSMMLSMSLSNMGQKKSMEMESIEVKLDESSEQKVRKELRLMIETIEACAWDMILSQN